MILTFLLFALVILRLHPDIAAARWLHLNLVERPAAAMQRMERHHWIALVLLLGLGGAGLAAEVAWLLALDSALIIDLTLAAWTLSTARGVRTGWRTTDRRVLRSAAPVRRWPRPRRSHKSIPRPAANDDGGARHAA